MAVGCGVVVGEVAVEGLLTGVGKPLINIIKKVILALTLLKGLKSVVEGLVKGLVEGLVEFKLLLIFFSLIMAASPFNYFSRL